MFRYHLACVLICLAGCDSKSLLPSKPSAQPDIEKGIAAQKAHNEHLAYACFTAALVIDPNNVEALSWRAWLQCSNSRQRYAAAIFDASAAIRIDPNFWLAYLARGNAYEWGKYDEDSMAEYEKAIALSPPDEYLAFQERGRRRLWGKKYAESLKDFDEAIRRGADGVGIYEMRGEALMGLDQFEDAISSFKKATDSKAFNDKQRHLQAYAHAQRAECLKRLGRISESEDAINLAGKMKPEFFPAKNDPSPRAEPPASPR